ncbi:MAG: SDR family oxidoreductase [Cetobacterium sp.]|uniref:SDR family oxidoreductase n=1 Tax=Cetobacterium sp. TaxID=2071632 RepID=UPI003F3A232E
MKILITGGEGFLGKRFKKEFQNKYEILNPGSEKLDITNKNEIFEYFEKNRPNIVFHFAAIAETKFCNENKELAQKINVDGAIFIAEACKQYNCKLVFASTEQVFNGNIEDGPYKEDQLSIPNTVYGQNKLDAEFKLKDILPELWILRFTWIFGLPEYKLDTPAEILNSTIKAILKNKKIEIDSNEFRGMAYVYDIVSNLEKVFDLPYGTYHFGSENDFERYDIVKYIFELISTKEKFEELVKKVPNKYGDKRDLRLDCSKLKEHGIEFSDTKTAIRNCLIDFGYIKG